MIDTLKVIIKEWKNTIFLFFGILTLALTLRIINLTILPVFGDEAIYIRWSQIMGAEPGLRFVPLTDGKQPLFMWILMFIVRRFSDPLIISRLTSVVYGIGTLVGVFVLSYVLFGCGGKAFSRVQNDKNRKARKIALLSSLFWAISPYSIFYDRLALVDSMLTMFGVWVLVFFILTIKLMRLDFAMISGFLLGGALLTKSPGLYFAAMLPVVWIVSKWPARSKEIRVGKKEFTHTIKLGLLTLTTLIIAFGMYNVLRLGESFHMIAIRNKDYVYPISSLWKSPLNPLITNVNVVYDWIWILGPSVMVVFILLSVIYQIKKYGSFDFKKIKRPKPEVALIFIWSTIPIVVSSIYAKVFAPRYVLFSLPTLFIFSALIFVYSYKNILIKKVLYFGFVLFLIQALYTDYLLLTKPEVVKLPRILRSGFLEEWTSGTGIKEASLFFRRKYQSNPKEKIVVGTEGYFGTLPDGLQMYLNDLTDIIVIGIGIGIKEVPKSLKESANAGNETYLLVNSSRLEVDPDTLGLDLIAIYQKAFRKPNTREFNLYGPRDSLLLFKAK
jgi:4-amino-4-deoxy-L-arabinose transferase-like glycosyltransferase